MDPEILEGNWMLEIERSILEEKLKKETERSGKKLIPMFLQGQEPKDHREYKEEVRRIVRSNGLYLHGQQ